MSGFRGAFIFGELCGRGTHLSWLLKNGIDIDIDRVLVLSTSTRYLLSYYLSLVFYLY